MKYLSKSKLLVASFSLLALGVFLPGTINAAPNDNSTQPGGATSSPENRRPAPTYNSNDAVEMPMQVEPRESNANAEKRRQEAQLKAQENRAGKQAKLDDKKLKVCQNREAKIRAQMYSLSERGSRHIQVFTQISDRTQAYYQKQGNVITNYDQLLADVIDKKASAESAVALSKSAADNFKCDGDDPKASVADFKSNLEAQNQAIKTYKTSLKSLITQVKSAQATNDSAGGVQ